MLHVPKSKIVLQINKNNFVVANVQNFGKIKQGILSVPGIAGYKWVPARIGHFCENKFFFIIPTAN